MSTLSLPTPLLSSCFQFCSHKHVTATCSHVNKLWQQVTKEDLSYHHETVTIRVKCDGIDEDEEEESHNTECIFTPLRDPYECACLWSRLHDLLSHLLHARKLSISVKWKAVTGSQDPWDALHSLPHLTSLEILDEQLNVATYVEEGEISSGAFHVHHSILSLPHLTHLRLMCELNIHSCAGLDWFVKSPRVGQLRAIMLNRINGWDKYDRTLEDEEGDMSKPDYVSRTTRLSCLSSLSILELSLPASQLGSGSEMLTEMKLWPDYFNCLESLQNLTYLSLCTFNISDDTLRSIAHLHHLIILKLDVTYDDDGRSWRPRRWTQDEDKDENEEKHMGLSLEGISQLQACTQLQVLHIQQTHTGSTQFTHLHINQKWAPILAGIPRLSYISFSDYSSSIVSLIDSLQTLTHSRLVGLHIGNTRQHVHGWGGWPRDHRTCAKSESDDSEHEHEDDEMPSISQIPACQQQPLNLLNSPDHDYARRYMPWLTQFRQANAWIEHMTQKEEEKKKIEEERKNKNKQMREAKTKKNAIVESHNNTITE